MSGNFSRPFIATILSLIISVSTYTPSAFAGLPAPCDGSASSSSSSSNSNTATVNTNLNSGTSSNSNSNTSSAAASVNNQTQTYCTAAKNADDAASAQEIETIIWGTVAGVCGVACAAYATGYGAIASTTVLAHVCEGVDIAGTASNLVLSLATSKKFSDSLTTLGNVAVQGAAAYLERASISTLGSLTSSASTTTTTATLGANGSSKTVTNSSGTASEKVSCTAFAIAAATAVVTGIEMGQSDKTRDQNIQNAQQLATSDGGSAVGGTATNAVQLTQANASSSGTAVGSGQATSASNVATNGGGSANALASCSSQSGGSTSAMLSCATSGNPKLQALVTNPDFLAGLQKTSGMDPGAFLNSIPSGASPGDVMAAAMGGLTDSQDMKNKLSGPLTDLNSQLLAAMNASGPAYASSGTGAGAKPSLGVSNLFGSDGGGSGVVGTAGETTQFRKTASLDVGGLNFKTDSDGIMQDRSVNLFEAVTAQYKKSKDGIEERPWAVPYNKYKMGQ